MTRYQDGLCIGEGQYPGKFSSSAPDPYTELIGQLLDSGQKLMLKRSAANVDNTAWVML